LSTICSFEPTGNLDEANEQIVLNLLRELHREGHTILMVTHAATIGQLADRRIELSHGRLASIGSSALKPEPV
jgi:putative ABC transport system ATP-binding protein